MKHILLSADALQPTVNDTAMKIHLQRIVGSFVTSAYGAAQFYSQKVTQARDLASKFANDDRDEDREVYGFDIPPPVPGGSLPKRTSLRLIGATSGVVHLFSRHRRGVEAVRGAAGWPRHGRPPGRGSRARRLRARQPGGEPKGSPLAAAAPSAAHMRITPAARPT